MFKIEFALVTSRELETCWNMPGWKSWEGLTGKSTTKLSWLTQFMLSTFTSKRRAWVLGATDPSSLPTWITSTAIWASFQRADTLKRPSLSEVVIWLLKMCHLDLSTWFPWERIAKPTLSFWVPLKALRTMDLHRQTSTRTITATSVYKAAPAKAGAQFSIDPRQISNFFYRYEWTPNTKLIPGVFSQEIWTDEPILQNGSSVQISGVIILPHLHWHTVYMSATEMSELQKRNLSLWWSVRKLVHQFKF